MMEKIKRAKERRFRVKRMLTKIGRFVQRRSRRHQDAIRFMSSKNEVEMEQVESAISSLEDRSASYLSLAKKEQESVDAFMIKLSTVSPPSTPSSFSSYGSEINALREEIRAILENIEDSIQTLSKKPKLTLKECDVKLAAYSASWTAQGAALSARHASTLAESYTLDLVTSKRLSILQSEEEKNYLNSSSRISDLESELKRVQAKTSELRMIFNTRKTSTFKSNLLSKRQYHVMKRSDMWLQKKRSDLQSKHGENLTKVKDLKENMKKKQNDWTKDHSTLLLQSREVGDELSGLLDSINKLAAQIGTC